MTVGEFRRVCASQIAAFAPDEASVLCDILLAHVLGCDRSALLLSLDRKLEEADARRMAEAVSELSLGVPVQYIVGSCWFYNREIKVGRGCFIPRGDTEFLAAAAVAALPEGGSFADLCSGSGCVAAAIASTLKPKKGYALELSRKALAYTEENLKDFDNVAVRRFDVLDEEDYLALAAELDGGVDVLVSNPPYIPTDDIAALDVQVHFEPENALDGGEDGLRYYREIVQRAADPQSGRHDFVRGGYPPVGRRAENPCGCGLFHRLHQGRSENRARRFGKKRLTTAKKRTIIFIIVVFLFAGGRPAGRSAADAAAGDGADHVKDK